MSTTETRLAKGALVISIDLELAWGVWDHVSPDDVDLASRLELSIVHELVALLDEYDVPATWAIVGRLMVPPRRDENLLGAPAAWFAPEAIDAVREATCPQEIGSHGYAHIYFGEHGRDELRADLRSAKELHERERLGFTSFVFPRNQVANVDLLAEVGIAVFRSHDAGLLKLAERFGKRARQLTNVAEKTIPTAPPIVFPKRHASGLVELPSSLLLLGRNGVRRVISSRVMLAKCRAGLHAAVEARGIFHLWFHPSNFYYERAKQMAVLRGTLAEARRLATNGELDLRTMGSFANAS